MQNGGAVVYKGNGQFLVYSAPFDDVGANRIECEELHFLNIFKLGKPKVPSGVGPCAIVPKSLRERLQELPDGDAIIVRNFPMSRYADMLLIIKRVHMFLFQCKNCATDMTNGQLHSELCKMGHPQYTNDADDDDDVEEGACADGHELTQELLNLSGLTAEQVHYCFLINRPPDFKSSASLGSKLAPGTTNVLVRYVAPVDLPMHRTQLPVKEATLQNATDDDRKVETVRPKRPRETKPS